MSELTLEQVVELLAQRNWIIRRVDLGGHDGHEYRLCGPQYGVSESMMRKLYRENWVTGLPSGTAYVLSDAGLKAHMKSTDEMGDGKLHAPSPPRDTP